MAFNLNNMLDTNYLDQLKETLVPRLLTEGITLDIIDIIPGVKNRVSLNLVKNNITVVDANCGFSPAGDVQLIQKALDVLPKAVNDTLCPKDLEVTYLGQYMKNNKQIPFIEIIADTYVNRVNRWNEQFIWDGDGTYAGLIEQIANDPLVIDASAEVDSAANPVEKLNALLSKASPEIKTHSNKVVFCSFAFYDAYMNYLRSQNVYMYANSEFKNGGYITTIPGTDIQLISTVALDSLVNNTITTGEALVYTYADNLVAGTDMMDDEEKFDIWYSRDADEVRVNIQWKIGVATRFGEDIVRGYAL
jgi:hypothetical protein